MTTNTKNVMTLRMTTLHLHKLFGAQRLVKVLLVGTSNLNLWNPHITLPKMASLSSLDASSSVKEVEKCDEIRRAARRNDT